MKNISKLFTLLPALLFTPYSFSSEFVELTNSDRRAFLEYYSPLIFKRADENDSEIGRDLITNYHFDGDQNFSNNFYNWDKKLDNYVESNYTNPDDEQWFEQWSIRPTLYSSIIEFTRYVDGTPQKDLVLLYNIYHPVNGDDQIHDWERFEIRVNDIQKTPTPNPTNHPGMNDYVPYVVLTQHHKHNAREGDLIHQGKDSDLNFFTTESGRHAMIWQAEWSESGSLEKNELRFVEDDFSYIDKEKGQNDTAKVDINGFDRKGFHYVFMIGSDQQAVDYWSAVQVDQSNISSVVANKERSSVKYSKVNGVTYELQDLADLVVTNAFTPGLHNNTTNDPVIYPCGTRSPSVYSNWFNNNGIDNTLGSMSVHITTELLDESGIPVIPIGHQEFKLYASDCANSSSKKRGIPAKGWFWGQYTYGQDREDYPNFVYPLDSSKQHNFLVHGGSKSNWQTDMMPLDHDSGWYLKENGGFDGRWVQLFDD